MVYLESTHGIFRATRGSILRTTLLLPTLLVNGGVVFGMVPLESHTNSRWETTMDVLHLLCQACNAVVVYSNTLRIHWRGNISI